MTRYIDGEKLLEYYEERYKNLCKKNGETDAYCQGYEDAMYAAEHIDFAADVVPRAEVEKIFEKLKNRERSNSVCTWCVHANAYGRRNEECDNSYIDKNGKEQRACYGYAKFESLIDNELSELKKKYTEQE